MLKEEGLQFPLQLMIVASDNPNDVTDSLTVATMLKVYVLSVLGSLLDHPFLGESSLTFSSGTGVPFVLISFNYAWKK